MKTTIAIVVAAAVALGAIAGTYLLLGNPVVGRDETGIVPRPVWTEVQWAFLLDQWGKGKAFQCKPADCGSEVNMYLRAKIGFCNCISGVADDAELERLSDFDLIGGELLPLGNGQPVEIGWMKGRSRAYKLIARNRPGKTAISVAYNDGCDAIVATIVLLHDRPEIIEPGVIEFLNTSTALSWAKATLAQ